MCGVCGTVRVLRRDDCIKDKPIYEWPLCHCLISFYSNGFPMEKAEAYIRLRRPYCINNLSRHVVDPVHVFLGASNTSAPPLHGPWRPAVDCLP